MKNPQRFNFKYSKQKDTMLKYELTYYSCSNRFCIHKSEFNYKKLVGNGWNIHYGKRRLSCYAYIVFDIILSQFVTDRQRRQFADNWREFKENLVQKFANFMVGTDVTINY